MAMKDWRLRTNETGRVVYDKAGQGTFEEVEIVTYDVPRDNGHWIVFIAKNGLRKKERHFKSTRAKERALEYARSYMRKN